MSCSVQDICYSSWKCYRSKASRFTRKGISWYTISAQVYSLEETKGPRWPHTRFCSFHTHESKGKPLNQVPNYIKKTGYIFYKTSLCVICKWWLLIWREMYLCLWAMGLESCMSPQQPGKDMSMLMLSEQEF